MRNIPVNAKVMCKDGYCGKPITIIVNLQNLKIIHFIIEDTAFPDSIKHMIPINKVVEMTEKQIDTELTKNELQTSLNFVTTHYLEMDEDTTEIISLARGSAMLSPYAYPSDPDILPIEEENIPKGEISILHDMNVEVKDSFIGHVNELLIDLASKKITHFILDSGYLWEKRNIAIPISTIDHITNESIFLSIPKKEVINFPDLSL